jgi:putative membrane protein
MVNALISFNFVVILVFLGGCVAGLICFSRFLTWTLINYHNATVALLTGFMLGSLNKAWPWREVLEYVTNSRGDQVPSFDRSILPWHYFNITGKDPQVFQAILMMAISVFIVVLFVKIAARLKTKI